MSGIWAPFEQRVAAEDPRTAYVRAYEMFTGLIALDDGAREAGLRVCLEREPRRVIEALYVMLIELTGGPEGRPGSLPDERRLWSMRAATSARVAELLGPAERLTEHDLAAAQQCTQADQDVASAVPAIAGGSFSAEHVNALRGALATYRAAIAELTLSDAGTRMLSWKVANALNWLARAAAASGAFEAAEQMFTESAHEHAASGDALGALASQQKAFEALEAVTPDADERLRRLSDAVDALSSGTLGHVQALLALAALEADHGDLFAARQHVKSICGELHEMQLPAPKDGAVDAAVIGWIGAIPRPDPPQPNFFLRMFAAIVQLHVELARLRMALRPERSREWQPILERGSAIAIELSDHTEVVHERLSETVRTFPVPAWVSASWPSAQSSQAPEYLSIMAELNDLLDTLGDPPEDAQAKANRLGRAERLLARARAYGKPVPLSQALWLQAAMLDGDARHAEAVGPLQEAASVVSLEGNAAERDAAITALTALCKVYAVLREHEQISVTAGQAIEAIERDRYRVNAPFLQSAFLSAYKDVFTLGVYSALELRDYRTMLGRTELSKARGSVLRLMRHDERSRDALHRLDGELRLLTAEIRSVEGDGRDDQLAALRERRQRLWNLRAIGAGAGDRPAPAPVPDLGAVQRTLADDEAVIYHYWLRPTVLLVVTLTAEEIEVERRSLSAPQRSNLERFVRVIATLKGTHYTLDGAFIAPLADVLLPDTGRRLLEGKRRLAISPHRLMHWFPFHAAPWDGAPLIREFAVRYVPNLASLLLETPEPRDPFVLELAVSEFPERESLGELAFVTAQAHEIADVYRARAIAVSLELEPSRERIAALIDDGSLAHVTAVHVATHGKSASADTPMDSVLQLADGPLDGLEISTWPLEHCELVTLSACEAGQLAITGRGMGELPGDEMFGLPAAFLEAGARSVLASVWPAVEASGEIIVSFHRFLAAGVAPDFALQAAQCEYLDAREGAPPRAYFWAGLFLLSLGRPAGESSR